MNQLHLVLYSGYGENRCMLSDEFNGELRLSLDGGIDVILRIDAEREDDGSLVVTASVPAEVLRNPRVEVALDGMRCKVQARVKPVEFGG